MLARSMCLSIALSLMATAALAAGSVTGTITFDGKAPNFKPISMDADPVCASKHKDAVMPQTLVLGEGQTMGNVFVYVKSGLTQTKFAPPAEAAVIDQQGCNYIPHVMGVMAGQKLKILNPDGTLHNVHAMSKVNAEFNLAMPKFRTEVEKIFDKPEFMFAMKCDVHPWMLAWVAVMPHPYFTVTKADGKFEIKDLPPGNYEIEAWHEKLGPKTAKVTVTDGGAATADFTFAAPNKS
jgi:plastocyanin